MLIKTLRKRLELGTFRALVILKRTQTYDSNNQAYIVNTTLVHANETDLTLLRRLLGDSKDGGVICKLVPLTEKEITQAVAAQLIENTKEFT